MDTDGHGWKEASKGPNGRGTAAAQVRSQRSEVGRGSRSDYRTPTTEYRIPDSVPPAAINHPPSTLNQLVREMGTTGRGTTLEGFAQAARRRGFDPRGVELTQKGLARQRLPLIALVRPGHFVIVERVTAAGVTVWNPEAGGPGRPGVETHSLAAWGKLWSGIALTLR